MNPPIDLIKTSIDYIDNFYEYYFSGSIEHNVKLTQ